MAVQAYQREYVREDRIAILYFRMGDIERSVEWWTKSVEANGGQIVGLADGDAYAAMRKDPRIQTLLKKAGAIK